MAKLIGVIDQQWANEVALEQVNIWNYNLYNGEQIQGSVPLDCLGNLAVGFTRAILIGEEITRLMQRHSTIDLAFRQPGLVTTTQALLTAAVDQRGPNDTLARKLMKRSQPDSEQGHGGNERWVFPVSALAIRETSEVTAG